MGQLGGTVTARSSDTNAVAATLISVSTTWASGDKLGVRIEGSTIQAWRQASGSPTGISSRLP